MCDQKYLPVVVRGSPCTLESDPDTLEIDRKFEDVLGDRIMIGDNAS